MEGKNQQWIYRKRPDTEVTSEHYELVETPIPQPTEEGDLLIKSLWISVDPYLRIQQSAKDSWEKPHALDTVQGAGVVGQVVESLDKTHGIQKGDYVLSYTGWQRYGIQKASTVSKLDPDVAPISTALGVLGMPGRTAYFGFLDAGKPKMGETVVVSGAAGAVGSLVVQIAKLRGCYVVALAGSKDKVEWIEKDLGADKVLNYKDYKNASELKHALEQVCPKGIDIYFDNTGGMITDAVFELINLRARVIICGQISQYLGGLDNPELGPRFLHKLIYTRATIQGILARDYVDRIPEMMAEMVPWVKENKLKYKETVVEGFEKLPQALNALFDGSNTGKMLVKV